MRAQEFIFEDKAKLDVAISDPLQNTYVIPGLTSQDPYKTYRFGVAIARARGQKSPDANFNSEFSSEGAFGENAVVSTFDKDDTEIIDIAMKMSNVKGGKIKIGSQESQEPDIINSHSPIVSFKGYPR